MEVKNAGVAQLVVQLIRNQQVEGPSPFTSSIKNAVNLWLTAFF